MTVKDCKIKKGFPMCSTFYLKVPISWCFSVITSNINLWLAKNKTNSPKDHWTLQWKGLNLYSRDRVLKIASFEWAGYLGCWNCKPFSEGKNSFQWRVYPGSLLPKRCQRQSSKKICFFVNRSLTKNLFFCMFQGLYLYTVCTLHMYLYRYLGFDPLPVPVSNEGLQLSLNIQ